MLIEPPTNGRKRSEGDRKKGARAILEMTDEVWREFQMLFSSSFAFVTEIKINVIALNVLQTIFIGFRLMPSKGEITFRFNPPK